MEDIILYFSYKHSGNWEKIFDSIEKHEKIDYTQLKKIKNKFKNKYITVLSNEYPNELRSISRPPFVLWVKGKKEILNKNNKLWYYGSYYDKKYENIILKHFNESKKENFTFITGYSTTFERNLVNKLNIKNSIIVRDSGINSYINMTRIEEEYLLKNNVIISEYPEKYTPSLESWENSNRIKSGLSIGMVLINSLKEKMMFKTIFNSLDVPRPVYCYKNNIDNKSHNHTLILNGACAINKLKDIK